MDRKLRHRLEIAVSRFKFNAQQPVKMHFFGCQILFEFFAAGGVEFDQHFAFLHVHENATRGDGTCRAKAATSSFAPWRVRQASVCCEI